MSDETPKKPEEESPAVGREKTVLGVGEPPAREKTVLGVGAGRERTLAGVGVGDDETEATGEEPVPPAAKLDAEARALVEPKKEPAASSPREPAPEREERQAITEPPRARIARERSEAVAAPASGGGGMGKLFLLVVLGGAAGAGYVYRDRIFGEMPPPPAAPPSATVAASAPPPRPPVSAMPSALGASAVDSGVAVKDASVEAGGNDAGLEAGAKDAGADAGRKDAGAAKDGGAKTAASVAPKSSAVPNPKPAKRSAADENPY